MCGIAAILSRKALNSNIKCYIDKISSMVSELHKRGPDYHEVYSNQNLYLGHTRLKILDPSDQANQPFIKNGSVLIFNGEIYNYKKLRERYLQDIDFLTNCDTEVLFHLLFRYGADVIEILDGQFAFIFYKSLDHKIIVARDHVGICPLYVHESKSDLVFCSHIYPIVKEYPIEFDEQGFIDYLSYRYTPQSSHTLFDKVSKFTPGTYWIVNCKTAEIQKYKYWDLNYKSHNGLISQKDFNTLLQSEVSKQLQGDVPIGVFLSGGVDSQSVLSCALNSNTKIQTITLCSGDDDDDKKGAVEFLSKNNLNGNFIKVDENIFENIEDSIFALEEPFGDLLALGNYELANQGSKIAKIFISGEGGDEIFLSYHHQIGFLKIYRLCRFKFISNLTAKIIYLLPPWLIGKLAGYPGSYTNNEKEKIIRILKLVNKKADCYKEMVSIFNDDEINKILSKSSTKIYKADKRMIEKAFKEELEDWQIIQKLDIKEFTLPINLLKQDKYAARFSLESRVPLISKQIISNVIQSMISKSTLIGKKDYLKNYIGIKNKNKIPFSLFNKADSREVTIKLFEKYVLTLKDSGFTKFNQDELVNIYLEIKSNSLISIKKASTLIIFGIWWKVFSPYLKDRNGNKLQMAK